MEEVAGAAGEHASNSPASDRDVDSRARNAMPKRCSYEGCEKPEESRQFISIDASTCAKKQDWSKLIGKVLCCTCYDRYRYSGSLERSKHRPLQESERRCSNAVCDGRSTRFRKIDEGVTAGSRDWSSVFGLVLCQTCYERFKTRGTLERSASRSVKNLKRCSNVNCDHRDQSRFFKIKEGKATGGVDWNCVAGQELCNTCYTNFRHTGLLARPPASFPVMSMSMDQAQVMQMQAQALQLHQAFSLSQLLAGHQMPAMQNPFRAMMGIHTPVAMLAQPALGLAQLPGLGKSYAMPGAEAGERRGADHGPDWQVPTDATPRSVIIGVPVACAQAIGESVAVGHDSNGGAKRRKVAAAEDGGQAERKSDAKQ